MAGKIITNMSGPRIVPASFTLRDRMARANSNATIMIAKSPMANAMRNNACNSIAGMPITLEDAKNAMAKNRPRICKTTLTPAIMATASHLPISRSIRLQGNDKSASRVPLSRSPAVISIDG